MGLRDVLTGIQNGPHGARHPTSGGSSGSMSPLVLALLGLLAYKAFKGRSGQTAPEGTAVPRGGTTTASTPRGGLGDILGGLFGGRSGPAQPGMSFDDLLRGGLGGLLGGAAGSVLSGGLGNLMRDFQASGQGETAESWVRPGPNRQIAPDDLANALGGDTLDALSRQTGMDRDDLLQGLSRHLPEFVDQLTPQGRLPTEEEASRMV
jgi:uncharacterized protein YidB (DUF937 family)